MYPDNILCFVDLLFTPKLRNKMKHIFFANFTNTKYVAITLLE